jgi:two-component system sensor histidine kinase KdpD
LTVSALLGIAFGLHAVGQVNATTAAVSMLVAILVAATHVRLAVAVISSIVAMLALNFLFFVPLYAFTIADPANWVALVAFLIVSVVTSQLAVAAQSRARDAEERRDEQARLFELNRDMLRTRQRADLASALLASLSHDLRTPLTAVSVAVANLQDPALSPEHREGQARLAAQELDRLTCLFRDILDMARIDASALTLEHDWVTPADIVDAALAALGPTLQERSVVVEADDVTVAQVDPRLTSAALSHLIENAAQYAPVDRPIRVHGSVNADGLHLAVRDEGPGLDPEEIDRVFERFYRGRWARAHAAGTGMGLAIARGLVAAEGGQVTGVNLPGGGAEFSIVIPAPSQAGTARE